MNRMKLEFLSRSENERFARMTAAAFLLELDPTVEELSEIKTAVSEAVTNAIIHGYNLGEGIITLEGILEDNTVTFIITDNGVGIADINLARQPLYTDKPELERSGMGFTVMESFMDKVYVESEPNKGSKITLIKALEVGNEI